MENHTNHSKKQQFSEIYDPKTQLENTTKSNSHTTQGQDTENLDYIYIKKNSVALVRVRTIPTERPPPVGEVSANFFADRRVSRGQRKGSPRPLISVFWTGAATFYSSSSSIDITRLSGHRSRPTTTQKIW